MKTRGGRFTISWQIIKDQPEAVIAAMTGMIIIRAESMRWNDVIEYLAIGPMFDEVEEGAEAPWYNAILWQEEKRNRKDEVVGYTVTIKGWERMK